MLRRLLARGVQRLRQHVDGREVDLAHGRDDDGAGGGATA